MQAKPEYDYVLDGNGSEAEVLARVDSMIAFEKERFAIDFTMALRRRGATDAVIAPRLEQALARWDATVGLQHSAMRKEIAAWVAATPAKNRVH